MSAAKSRPVVNQLLEALPRGERVSLLGNCESVDLVFGDILCEPGKPINYAYFPTAGFISLLTPVDGRTSLEVGLVGDDGMLGLGMLLGVQASPLQGLVQGAGSAWRISAPLFYRELRRSPGLKAMLSRYVYVVMSQIALSAACNRYHVVAGRLARWLLMTADRAHAESFVITHEFLAHMLGVRRAGVTRAASALRRRRLIRYSRGHVTILDRPGLDAASCSCYMVSKEMHERTMRPPVAFRPRPVGRAFVRNRTEPDGNTGAPSPYAS